MGCTWFGAGSTSTMRLRAYYVFHLDVRLRPCFVTRPADECAVVGRPMFAHFHIPSQPVILAGCAEVVCPVSDCFLPTQVTFPLSFVPPNPPLTKLFHPLVTIAKRSITWAIDGVASVHQARSTLISFGTDQSQAKPSFFPRMRKDLLNSTFLT